MSDLKTLSALASAFLAAADFPDPYSSKTLGWKVGVNMLQHTGEEGDPDKITDDLSKQRSLAKLLQRDNYEELSLKLAEYFALQVSRQKFDAEAASLIPLNMIASDTAEALEKSQAPHLANLVRKAQAGETTPVVPDQRRRPLGPFKPFPDAA